MSTCWLSFRLHDDQGYDKTYTTLQETVQELSQSQWWFETSSFYVFECEAGARKAAAAVKKVIRQDRDIVVVGSFGFKTCIVLSKCDDQDIFELVDFAKKL